MSIAYYFDASKQQGDEFIPGVPLSDIDEAWLNEQPDHIKSAVDQSPLYRKTRPPEATKRRAADDKEG